MLKRIVVLLFVFFVGWPVFANESLTLVAEDDWYPYSAERDNQPIGISVDIIRAAYQAAGVDVSFINKSYDVCMAEVKYGKYVGCFDTSKDVATALDYIYPQEPLFYATFGIYARANYTGGATMATLEGKKVRLTSGYTYGKLENNTKIGRYYGAGDLDGLRRLANGEYDFAIVYTKVADAILKANAKEFSGKVKLVGTTETVPIYISFSQAHPKGKLASELFDQGMQLIKKNGTYNKIEAEWNIKLCGASVCSVVSQ